MAWKINFENNRGERRTVYTSCTTRAEALAIAETVYNIYHPVGADYTTDAEIAEWDPDGPNKDADDVCSLESAILWALGK